MTEDINNLVAKLILKIANKELGLDQRWISTHFNCSQQLISKIANGKRKTSRADVDELAQICGLNTEILYNPIYYDLLYQNLYKQKPVEIYELILMKENKKYLPSKLMWSELITRLFERYNSFPVSSTPYTGLCHNLKVALKEDFKYFQINCYQNKVNVSDGLPTNGTFGSGSRPCVLIEYPIIENAYLQVGMWFPDELNCKLEDDINHSCIILAITLSSINIESPIGGYIEKIKEYCYSEENTYKNCILFDNIDFNVSKITGLVDEEEPCRYEIESLQTVLKAKDQFAPELYMPDVCFAYIPIEIERIDNKINNEYINVINYKIDENLNTILALYKAILKDALEIEIEKNYNEIEFQKFDDTVEENRRFNALEMLFSSNCNDTEDKQDSIDQCHLLDDFKLRIKKLQYMKDIGIITDEEYENKRLEILNSI